MLGMTLLVGMFFGLPLDMRRVDADDGTVAFAAASLGRDYFSQGWFIESLAGVGVIFVLNLTTSFAIALLLAMRAYDISARNSGFPCAGVRPAAVELPAGILPPAAPCRIRSIR